MFQLKTQKQDSNDLKQKLNLLTTAESGKPVLAKCISAETQISHKESVSFEKESVTKAKMLKNGNQKQEGVCTPNLDSREDSKEARHSKSSSKKMRVYPNKTYEKGESEQQKFLSQSIDHTSSFGNNRTKQLQTIHHNPKQNNNSLQDSNSFNPFFSQDYLNQLLSKQLNNNNKNNKKMLEQQQQQDIQIASQLINENISDQFQSKNIDLSFISIPNFKQDTPSLTDSFRTGCFPMESQDTQPSPSSEQIKKHKKQIIKQDSDIFQIKKDNIYENKRYSKEKLENKEITMSPFKNKQILKVRSSHLRQNENNNINNFNSGQLPIYIKLDNINLKTQQNEVYPSTLFSHPSKQKESSLGGRTELKQKNSISMQQGSQQALINTSLDTISAINNDRLPPKFKGCSQSGKKNQKINNDEIEFNYHNNNSATKNINLNDKLISNNIGFKNTSTQLLLQQCKSQIKQERLPKKDFSLEKQLIHQENMRNSINKLRRTQQIEYLNDGAYNKGRLHTEMKQFHQSAEDQKYNQNSYNNITFYQSENKTIQPQTENILSDDSFTQLPLINHPQNSISQTQISISSMEKLSPHIEKNKLYTEYLDSLYDSKMIKKDIYQQEKVNQQRMNVPQYQSCSLEARSLSALSSNYYLRNQQQQLIQQQSQQQIPLKSESLDYKDREIEFVHNFNKQYSNKTYNYKLNNMNSYYNNQMQLEQTKKPFSQIGNSNQIPAMQYQYKYLMALNNQRKILQSDQQQYQEQWQQIQPQSQQLNSNILSNQISSLRTVGSVGVVDPFSDMNININNTSSASSSDFLVNRIVRSVSTGCEIPSNFSLKASLPPPSQSFQTKQSQQQNQSLKIVQKDKEQNNTTNTHYYQSINIDNKQIKLSDKQKFPRDIFTPNVRVMRKKLNQPI